MDKKKKKNEKEDQKYWENILAKNNLSMDRGSFGDSKQRTAILIFLERVEEKEADKQEFLRRATGLTIQEI